MIILNFIPTFNWASGAIEHSEWGPGKFAKVNIAHESFWIKDCQPTEVEGNPAFEGEIDNDLINTDIHGLRLGDRVVFIPTQE